MELPGDTGDTAEGIASNPLGDPIRTHGVWLASDEALLAGLAGGDRDAAVAFVRRYQRRVYGLAMTLVGDRDLADDIAQEAMVRAWRHAAAFDARRGSVTTWLLAITRNLAIDSLRSSRVRPVADDVLIAALPTVGDIPGDTSVAVDELRRVADALGAIPEEQRRALLLVRLRGLTAAEVAAREGIPLGTAKTRIRTALLRLRSELRPEDAPT
jgi:RNA polymerase sigma-70 factor (ECF subfamily)